MRSFIFLILRRMRRPLLTLLFVYSAAVIGLVLIPGKTVDGVTTHMSFFHAFYFVSFMGTTIGFGEIPHPFTDAQRLWVLLCIYATVISWIYAIGNVLALIQDKAFKSALAEMRFSRYVRQLTEPFYLIIGYGQTGRELVRSLTRRKQHAVVVDRNENRINQIQLENLPEAVPAFVGDGRWPTHLKEGGLEHPKCAGVVALTDVNETNLKIAITSKLLHPNITVICRADSHDVEANMASFGTDYIIDPFDTFAVHLATALDSPALYLLHQWLTGVSQSKLKEPVYPPSEGSWVVCGYGRFGKAVYQRLKRRGLDVVVIEASPEKTGVPDDDRLVVGRGTEAHTLQDAGIENAVGLVAGTDNDANNLSIILTARELNADLFVLARQNHEDNQALFDAVCADIVMQPSSIIANRIRMLLGTPMLYEFMQLAKSQDDDWACELVSRIIAIVSTRVPEVWEFAITEREFPAAWNYVKQDGGVITIGDLMREQGDRDQQLPAIPLMIRHEGNRVLVPDLETRVRADDQILWCGRESARQEMAWTLSDRQSLIFAATGEVPIQSTVLKWIFARERIPAGTEKGSDSA